MKSFEGRSCRKMVRFLEIERGFALEGRAIDRNEDYAPKGVLPRPLPEIDADLALWRGRAAGPEPAPPPVVPPESRPSCRQCGTKLRPTFDVVSRRVETAWGHHTLDEPGGVVGFGYGAQGHFCSLRCGWVFALAVLAAEERKHA